MPDTTEAKVTIRMPMSLRRRLKVRAAKDDTTLNEIVIRAVLALLANGRDRQPENTP